MHYGVTVDRLRLEACRLLGLHPLRDWPGLTASERGEFLAYARGVMAEEAERERRMLEAMAEAVGAQLAARGLG